MYKNGSGVEKSASRTEALFKRACEGGNAEGCSLLRELKSQ